MCGLKISAFISSRIIRIVQFFMSQMCFPKKNKYSLQSDSTCYEDSMIHFDNIFRVFITIYAYI